MQGWRAQNLSRQPALSLDCPHEEEVSPYIHPELLSHASLDGEIPFAKFRFVERQHLHPTCPKITTALELFVGLPHN